MTSTGSHDNNGKIHDPISAHPAATMQITARTKYSLGVAATVGHGQKARDGMGDIGIARYSPLVVELVAADKKKETLSAMSRKTSHIPHIFRTRNLLDRFSTGSIAALEVTTLYSNPKRIDKFHRANM